MQIKANAKINLTLDIIGKRDDGYHELEMIMQSVDLHDNVFVELNNSGKITVKTSSELLADDESNIAYKAAKAFFESSGIKNQGVSIQIEKLIPMEAGMAGGSADGAAVITALNKLCGTNYNDEQLWEIGVKVGADVPFCITGGSMLAKGKGEQLEVLPQLSDFSKAPIILLCKPDVGVSTGKAYSAVDNYPEGKIIRPDTQAMITALEKQDVSSLSNGLCNVFEQVLNINECNIIKETMLKYGAIGACMTGSGTTVFGIFDSNEKAEKCYDELKNINNCTYISKACKCGCEIK